MAAAPSLGLFPEAEPPTELFPLEAPRPPEWRHDIDLAFDWSMRYGVNAYDGRRHTLYASIDALLDTLARPTTMVCESTFESYDQAKRQEVIARAAAEGHRLLTIHPRVTARRRRAEHNAACRADLDIEDCGVHGKSDHVDAETIWRIATTSGKHLKLASPADAAWAARAAKLNYDHTVDRWSRRMDAYVERFFAYLGPPEAWDLRQRAAFLRKDRGVRPHLAHAVVRAAEASPTRAEFERLLGLYEHGYPSHLRSDVVHWGYANGKTGHKSFQPHSWRAYRRELRRAYHIIRAAMGEGTPQPATGTSEPRFPTSGL